jgi:hypothetical protein
LDEFAEVGVLTLQIDAAMLNLQAEALLQPFQPKIHLRWQERLAQLPR